MALHKDLGLQYAHVPYFKTYASSVERLADSSLLEEDEGKLARQLSDNTLWMLVDYSVPTWVAVGSGGGGGSGDNNIDGGFANSVYLPSQLIDGGDANG